MLHQDQDASAYPAPQTTGQTDPAAEAKGVDGMVRLTHNDQHNGGGATRTLSHTLFSSLLYKGKSISPYARARLNKKSFGRSGTRLVIPSEHTSTLSLLGKRQAELWVVLAGRCPN